MPMSEGEFVPSKANIYGAKSEEEINSLPISTDTKYHPRNFIPIPPFLINSIDKAIENFNGDGTKILI